MEMPYAEGAPAPGNEALGIAVQIYAPAEMQRCCDNSYGRVNMQRLARLAEGYHCSVGDLETRVPFAVYRAGAMPEPTQQNDLADALRSRLMHITENMPIDKSVLNHFAPTVYFVADARARFEKIYRVMLAANSAGVNRFAFVVRNNCDYYPHEPEQGGSLLGFGGEPKDDATEMRPATGAIPFELPNFTGLFSGRKMLEINIDSLNSVSLSDGFRAEIQVADATELNLRLGDAGFEEERQLFALADCLKRLYPGEQIATQPITVAVAPGAKYQRFLDVMHVLHKLGVKAVAFKIYLDD